MKKEGRSLILKKKCHSLSWDDRETIELLLELLQKLSMELLKLKD